MYVCMFVVCGVCGVWYVCAWCVFVVCVCGVCAWSVCKATLARSHVIDCAFKVVPQYLSEESETRFFMCRLRVNGHGFLLSTYNSLPGGGVTKITDIIFMVQHATINSLLML